MIKNYLKIALRNLRRRSGFALINGAGFAAGMACCILIALFVQHEYAFDRQHEKADRIYRINKRVQQPEGPEEYHAITAGAMGPAIAALYPEVEQSVRLLPWFDEVLFEKAGTHYEVSDVVFVDANFFEVFDFELVRGSATRALVAPLSMVLSESVAARMFGEEDPVGQTVTGLNDLQYTVTGIVEDPPATSHIRYNVLVSWSSTSPGEATLNFTWLNRWLTQVNYTYLLLAEGANPAALEARFPALLAQNLPERASVYSLYLQPLKEVYLHSANLQFTRGLKLGNQGYVTVFIVVALLILLIACINFTNLTTAQSSRREKEVGVRKALGAERMQISRQFFVESALLIGCSMIGAVMLVLVSLPAFNGFIDRELSFNLLQNGRLLAGVAGLVVLTILMASSYPAIVLSRYRPIKALTKGSAPQLQGVSLRQVLVTAQFVATIVLIAGSIVVQRQLRFAQEKDPGFEREQILVLPTGGTAIAGQFDAFKQEVLRHPNIIGAAGSSSIPGTRAEMMSFQLRAEGRTEDENTQAYVWRIDDFDLVDTYDMMIAAGRYFSASFATDSAGAIVINEALAHRLGWQDPIGKKLDIPGEIEGSRVIGVIQDFHFESLHHPIEPLALFLAPRYENLSLRLAGGSTSEILAFLSDKWGQFEQVRPFEYTFLDASAAAYYATEERLMQTLVFFTLLALLIACMGLFGLVALTVQQRTKEIGIRKVIGANVANLVGLLTRDFLQLVGVAFLLAIPIIYLAARHWLEGFAFRISISWWIFAVAGIIALSIAFITVSVHCIRAALANPVKALRWE